MGVLGRKWGFLAVGLAVSAFLATFYVAYAGIVQWSREQPATLTTIAAVPLASSTMSLFQDEALTDPLTEDEALQFLLVQLVPPLPAGVGFDRITLFLRNDSPDTPLSLFRNFERIFDPVTDEFLAAYQVFGECCPEAPIPPGGSQRIFIDVFDVQPAAAGAQFTVVIGALGETANGGAAVSTISPQLQAVLDSAAQEKPGQ